MDLIAGEVGFYEPMFRPIFDEEFQKAGEFSFEMVERVRQRFSPEASFHATLSACLKRVPNAALLVEVRLGLKAEEQRELQSSQRTLFPKPAPQPRLRVSRIVANDAARLRNLRIHRNMQVPEASVLHCLFFKCATEQAQLASRENLGLWSSKGRFLRGTDVKVQARRYEDSILAIISTKAP